VTDDERQERKQKVFRAVMAGLMVGSGVFLALRYFFNVGVDPSLIAGAGLGITVGMFLLQQVDRK
jgi:hypothetical protein